MSKEREKCIQARAALEKAAIAFAAAAKDWEDADATPRAPSSLLLALAPLVAIADAYDENALDDEARKTWGRNDEYTNNRDPATIELYTGRGGRRLLTLVDCLAARAVVRGAAPPGQETAPTPPAEIAARIQELKSEWAEKRGTGR